MEMRCEIRKKDEEKRLVFGFASVSASSDGTQIVDSQGDVIEIEELEEAAYKFVQAGGEGGEMHERKGVAKLIESMVFTPEKIELLGLSGMKQGWFVGFKVTDEEVWTRIKNGEYKMFSIGGRAKEEEI